MTKRVVFILLSAVIIFNAPAIQANAQKQIQKIKANVLEEILDYSGLTNATAVLNTKAGEEAESYGVVVTKGEALAAAQAEFDTAVAEWEAAKTATDTANDDVQTELGALRPTGEQ